MDNYYYYTVANKKTSLIACLFISALFLLTHNVVAQQWQFDTNTLEAYQRVLNLHTTEALALVANPKTTEQHYVASLAQVAELLITEDPQKYSRYEDLFQKRLTRKTKVHSPEDLFLLAEIHLQWAFVYLKFGHDFDAALNLRRAYTIAQDCKKEFPQFIAIKKTIGLLHIILGVVPEKYNWVLNMLSMEGSFTSGLKLLESSELANSPLAFEAKLLVALVQTFVFQKPEAGAEKINSILALYPDNRLVLFEGAILKIKNAQSEEASKLLTRLSALDQGLPLPYINYLAGEVLLQKGDYRQALTSYQTFIIHYKGQSYVKDAHYKIGLCYLLQGRTNEATIAFRKTKEVGGEITEADRYAARQVAENELPNVNLTKARYLIDGGYYEEAGMLLQSITPKDIPTKRNNVEYYYRKARLAHKTKHLPSAELFYKQVIDMSEDNPWYYAPNACLQLGYIAIDDNDLVAAEFYFRKARSYKKHEYKNSIDGKAKLALAQMMKRK